VDKTVRLMMHAAPFPEEAVSPKPPAIEALKAILPPANDVREFLVKPAFHTRHATILYRQQRRRTLGAVRK
jgi:hypothetical protein